MIFVCDFFVISRKVYEKKISDLPLEKVESHLSSTMSQEGIVALCGRGSMQSLFYRGSIIGCLKTAKPPKFALLTCQPQAISSHKPQPSVVVVVVVLL